MSDYPRTKKATTQGANEIGISFRLRQLREIEAIEREMLELTAWIKTAAPVMESAFCIVIEDSIHRLDEIAGCQTIMETCPVEVEKLASVLEWPKPKEAR